MEKSKSLKNKGQFNFRFIIDTNSQTFNEKASYCCNRMFRQLILKGQPLGVIYHCIFKYNKDNRIFGSIVLSPGGRILFFPGVYPMMLPSCQSPLDHITLDANFASCHFKMMDRNEKIDSYPAYLHKGSILLWFSLIVDEMVKYPIFENSGIQAKVPISDYERRKEEVEKSFRPLHLFSLESLKCEKNERICFSILLSKQKITEDELIFYNHIGISKNYKQASRKIIVKEVENEETDYRIYIIVAKVECISNPPEIEFLYLRKKSQIC